MPMRTELKKLNEKLRADDHADDENDAPLLLFSDASKADH